MRTELGLSGVRALMLFRRSISTISRADSERVASRAGAPLPKLTNEWLCGAPFLLLLLTLGGYTVWLALPALSGFRSAKVAENSLEYSVQNTARHALHSPLRGFEPLASIGRDGERRNSDVTAFAAVNSVQASAVRT